MNANCLLIQYYSTSSWPFHRTCLLNTGHCICSDFACCLPLRYDFQWLHVMNTWFFIKLLHVRSYTSYTESLHDEMQKYKHILVLYHTEAFHWFGLFTIIAGFEWLTFHSIAVVLTDALSLFIISLFMIFIIIQCMDTALAPMRLHSQCVMFRLWACVWMSKSSQFKAFQGYPFVSPSVSTRSEPFM